MTKPFQEFLLRFVAATANGRRLSTVTTGGGISLCQLGAIPGASGLLVSTYTPYSTDESVYFIKTNYPMARRKGEGFREKAVSATSAEELYQALWTKNKAAGHTLIDNIAVTASLTTTRWRKGDNQAFITIENPKTLETETWHLRFSKFNQSDHERLSELDVFLVRTVQDEAVATTALSLATGFERDRLEEDIFSGNLCKVGT